MTDYVQGLDGLLETIEKLKEVKQEFGKEALRRVQDYTPVETGNLRNSWELTETDGEMTIQNNAVDEQGTYYGVFVDQGTVHQAGQFFVERTMAEAEQIWQVAKEKAGLP